MIGKAATPRTRSEGAELPQARRTSQKPVQTLPATRLDPFVAAGTQPSPDVPRQWLKRFFALPMFIPPAEPSEPYPTDANGRAVYDAVTEKMLADAVRLSAEADAMMVRYRARGPARYVSPPELPPPTP